MTWAPIEPYRYTGNARSAKPVCTASISLGRKASTAKQRMRLMLMFRMARIDTPPLWLQIGGVCMASGGWGPNHGMIRLEPGELFNVSKLGGRCETGAVRIIMPLPPTLLAVARAPVGVQMRQHGEIVDVEFPVDWRAPNAVPVPGHAAVMKAGGKGMFR